MAQPTPYTRQTDFSDYQDANPSDPLVGTDLDLELDSIKITLDEILTNLALIQRDDTKLGNNTVHKDAFDEDALNLIGGSAGWTPKGDWTTSTSYSAKDMVRQSDATYVAIEDHTSGTFATDLAAGKWLALTNSQIRVASDDDSEGFLADKVVAGPGTALAEKDSGGDKTLEVSASDNHWYAVDSGSADAYVVTLDPAPTSYVAGMVVRFKTTNANTGASTINVNGIGVASIKRKRDGGDLQSGDIVSGPVYTLVYDGSNFRLDSEQQASSSEFGSVKFPVAVSEGGTGATTASGARTALGALEDTFDDDLADDSSASKGDALIGYKRTETGGVARTLHAWMQDQAFNVKDFGAEGDGSTDDTTAIQAAIDAAETAGGGIVYFPPGTYKLTAALDLKAKVILRGVGRLSRIEQHSISNVPVIQAQGSRDTGESNTLASDASPGDLTITLSTNKGANFSADDWAIIRSDDSMWTGNSQNTAEFVRVKSVASDTITLETPLALSYTTGNNAELQKVTFVNSPQIEDLELSNTDPVNNLANVVQFVWCLFPAARNIYIDGNDNERAGIAFFACLGHTVNGYTIEDGASSATKLGYAISEAGLNMAGTFSNIVASRVRHLYTSLNSGTTIPDGVSMHATISNAKAVDSRGAGFDTHEEALGTTFSLCEVAGGDFVGFQIRGRDITLNACRARDLIGAGVWVVDDQVEGTTIQGFSARRTNSGTDVESSIDWTERGAIHDEGIDTVVAACRTEKSGGPGILQSDSGDNAVYCGNIVRDPCQLASTNTFGMGSEVTVAASVLISGNRIRATDTNMDEGVKIADADVDGLVFGNHVTGEQTEKISLNQTPASLNYGGQLLGIGNNIVATLVSGDLDLKKVSGSVISVAAESSTTDNMDTVSGAPVGSIVMIRRDGSDTITVRHNTAGTGLPILLNGATNATLDSSLKIITLLKLNTSNWIEISRNF